MEVDFVLSLQEFILILQFRNILSIITYQYNKFLILRLAKKLDMPIFSIDYTLVPSKLQIIFI